MIRYRITASALRRRIENLVPGWLERAERSTDGHQAAGTFSSESPGWSEIKAVFMALQHDKCAYCERLLESDDHGKIEHDVEHFRPKNGVPVWPGPAAIRDRELSYDFALGDPLDSGYYLLAHAVENYVTACKVCNTRFKSSCFPVESTRVTGSRVVRDHDAERALLPMPLGDRGFRPETVIGFDGIVAIPRYRTGRKHRIGRVTIDFFGLNERDTLELERSEALVGVWLAVASLDSGDAITRGVARGALDYLMSDAAPHASCSRHFRALIDDDRSRAAQYVTQARALLNASR